MLKGHFNTVFYIIAIVFFVSSCEGGNEEYAIDSPDIIVSNPVPSIGEEVTFYYRTDISGTPKWNLGDGTVSTDALITHVFTEEGTFNVLLEFLDGKGGVANSSITVEVMGKRLTDELSRLIDNPSELWVCAHRANTRFGLQNGIPENSIEAIQKSIEVGAEMVEIDVRLSSDGHFVLMHDATLGRTTNASGNVKDKTLNELKSYKLRDASGKITNHTIPTLEEALLTGRGKIYFNMDKVGEISNVRDQRKLVQLIDSLNMFDRVLFYVSGNSEIATGLKNVNQKSLIFPWASTLSALNSWSAYSNTNLIQLNYQAEGVANIVAEAHKKQMVSYSNILNNAGDNQMLGGNYSYIDQAKSLQIQVIQTDYVDMVKEYLAR